MSCRSKNGSGGRSGFELKAPTSIFPSLEGGLVRSAEGCPWPGTGGTLRRIFSRQSWVVLAGRKLCFPWKMSKSRTGSLSAGHPRQMLTMSFSPGVECR
jgi:hypothetical protein